MDKSKYFFRIVLMSVEGEEASIADPLDTSKLTPLDPWLGAVFALADGQHTLEQLLDYMGRRYPAGPPENLERTIDSVVERLLESEVIKLDDAPVTLPYYLGLPVNQQDADKARQLMLQDGYITTY